jgi:hypothetical protein
MLKVLFPVTANPAMVLKWTIRAVAVAEAEKHSEKNASVVPA